MKLLFSSVWPHKGIFCFPHTCRYMVLKILWRIYLFLVILSWKALLNIDITSSFWPSAIDIKFSLISRHLLCPGWSKWRFIRVPKFAQSFIEFLTNACSELLNKTQHKQKTPLSESEYLSHLYFSSQDRLKRLLVPRISVRGKTNDDGISHLFFSKNNFCWSSTFDLSKDKSKLFGWIDLDLEVLDLDKITPKKIIL